MAHAPNLDPSALDPAELRADLARLNITNYEIAAHVGVNPGRLGQMLRGTLPMPARYAARVREVLTERGANA